jgi:hypothetical protein
MLIFFGDQIDGWRLWGVWFRHTYFVGISVAVRGA